MYDPQTVERIEDIDNLNQRKQAEKAVAENLARAREHRMKLEQRRNAQHQKIVNSPGYESPVDKYARMFGGRS